METILEKIIRSRQLDLERDRLQISLQEMEARAKSHPTPSNFLEKLSRPTPGALHIIAEVKKASPSKGIIAENFAPLSIAQDYELGGASALSVLTEEKFFLGENQYLQEIAQHVSLPILRKDFIIDPYQIYQAKCLGASAFLLIVDCLTSKQIGEYIKIGLEIGLTALVEVHRETEVDIAISEGAQLIGVNNRNLRTFETSLDVSVKLSEKIPKNIITVSESGIETHKDLLLLAEKGYNAVLIGEKLMRNPKTIVSSLKELLNRV